MAADRSWSSFLTPLEPLEPLEDDGVIVYPTAAAGLSRPGNTIHSGNKSFTDFSKLQNDSNSFLKVKNLPLCQGRLSPSAWRSFFRLGYHLHLNLKCYLYRIGSTV